MKLRNKKTGEIVEGGFIMTYYDAIVGNPQKSLAELNEEWEDYKPTESLIKDEKVRELVADWAKLTQTTKILTVKRRTTAGTRYTEFFSQDKHISISIQGELPKIKHWEEYSVEELCGEDK